MDGEEEEEEAIGPGDAPHADPLSNAARRTLRANYRKMQSKTVGERRRAPRCGPCASLRAPCGARHSRSRRADEKDELALPTNGLLVKRLDEVEQLHQDGERGARWRDGAVRLTLSLQPRASPSARPARAGDGHTGAGGACQHRAADG